jgi:hypothetical protein
VGAMAPRPEDHLMGLAERFHQVARQLRDRRAGRPPLIIQDEYDVQYLLHALLRVFYNDIRPEETAPSHAGAAARMDFFLPEIGTAVETKVARPSLSEKELGEQLIIDIEKFRKYSGFRKLLCLVYDPSDQISNPSELEADLSGPRDGVDVRVMIVPKR